MTEKLDTLTAKIDALRAKGFSDDEINQLLSSQAQAEVPESPFNIGEIFNNGASKEEWNQQVDETEQLYIKQGVIVWVCLGLFAIFLSLGVNGVIPEYWIFPLCFSVICVCILALTFFMPKNRDKIKFFVKKRR